MLVKELIEKLQKCDPESEVFVHQEMWGICVSEAGTDFGHDETTEVLGVGVEKKKKNIKRPAKVVISGGCFPSLGDQGRQGVETI